MLRTLMAIMSDSNNYESRKVARDEVGGLIISTAYSSDCGYETAIIDASQTSPVERYRSREQAELGHKKWCKKAKTLKKVTMLGDADGWMDEETVTLKRKKSSEAPDAKA